MRHDRNLSDWREILAGAQQDEAGSLEWLLDCEQTLVKARERHETDLRHLAHIAQHVALLEELAAEPLERAQ